MKALSVERAKDKELWVVSETGQSHAAACFVDGIMVATDCTYGKSNIKKLYYGKMAFTLMEKLLNLPETEFLTIKRPFQTGGKQEWHCAEDLLIVVTEASVCAIP